MIKGCIFDLDGTLLDTLTSLWYCAGLTLKEEGLMELPKENYRYYVGDGAKKQVERFLRDTKVLDRAANTHDPHDPENLEHFYNRYMQHLRAHADHGVHPYPGIPELLKALKARGMKLAVFSNKPDAPCRAIIEKYFPDTFDRVLGKKDENPRKPDPFGAFLLAKELGLEPSELLYIGDTDTDMKTGTAAGMCTIGVLWGFRDRAELLANGAVHLAEAPEAIETILSAANA